MIYCIAGNFQEENFRKFSGYVTIREIFLREIWGVVSFGTAQASNLQKVFSMKIVFFTNPQKFSPTQVSHALYRYYYKVEVAISCCYSCSSTCS